MSELIGFIPDEPATQEFQGRPVDPKTGLIGFIPNEPGSYEDQESQVPQELRDLNRQVQEEADATPEKNVYLDGPFQKMWKAATTPLLNPSKALTLGKQLDYVAGKPYIPTEDDWNYWVIGKLDNINRQMFPNGRQPGVEWMTQNNAPAELLKTLRHEFETKFVGVPQGGRPPEEQSDALKVIGGVVKGVEAVAGGTADFLTSPVGAATLGVGMLPKLAQQAVGGAFMTHMATQYPELWKRAEEAARKGDDGELAQVGTETALNTLFMGLIGVSVASKGSKGEAGVPAADPAANAKYRFEQRPGETTAQFKQRFSDFAEQLEAWKLANEQGVREKPVSGKAFNVDHAPLGRLALLQDNPVLSEAGKVLGEGPKAPEPVKLDMTFKEDVAPPATAPKPELQTALEGALRSVLKLPAETPKDASQSGMVQSPSPEIKVAPEAIGNVKVAPVATKPWDIRRKLEERSRSQGVPIEKISPPEPTEVAEVPDSHPIARFWNTPDSLNYARVKANEAFPNNPVLADEAATEAHAHLYLNASKFKGMADQAKPWSFRTIQNYVTDKARSESKRNQQSAELDETIPGTEQAPDYLADMAEMGAAIDRFQTGLTKAERKLFDAMRGEGKKSLSDLAKAQGVSASTVSRQARELRGRLVESLRKENIDINDYIEVMDGIEAEPGIASSVRSGGRFKGTQRQSEGGFNNIIPALTRIIAGWMKAGASAARAVGHAVKVFGKRVLAPATRIASKAGFTSRSVQMGRNRPVQPLRPYIPPTKGTPSNATLRSASMLRRPANWSGVDKLRESGLVEEADRILQHEDRVAELDGRYLTPVATIQQKYPAKDYKKGVEQFAEYFRLRESRDNGKTKAQADADASAYWLTMGRAGRELVDYEKWVVSELGDRSRQLGVQVNDGGKWRLGNYNNDHYPRRPSKEFQEAISDPNKNPVTKAYFDQLKQDMVRNGNASNLAEAEQMLTREGWKDKFEGGFLATTERARGKKLPDRIYENSIEDFLDYVARTTDRLSQIEHFGQSLDGTQPTMFEMARSKTTDPSLNRLIKEARDHYYRDAQTPEGSEGMRRLDAVTTMAYLGLSPLGAARNMASGMASSMTQYGIPNTLAATVKVLASDVESAAKTFINHMGGNALPVKSRDALVAQELGFIQRDMAYAVLSEKLNSDALRKGVKHALTFNTIAEHLTRRITGLAAETYLRHTEMLHSWSPDNIATRTHLANIRRLGFKPQEVTDLLAGDQTMRDKFLRLAVKETQFGYQASQQSTLFDKAWARVFLKFGSWGAQMSRYVDRNVLQPLTQKEGGKWTPDLLPLIKLMAIVFPLVGEGYQEIRERVFGKPRKDASIEEIKAAFSEDQMKGLALAAQRYTTDLIYGGGLGVIGDYAGYLREFSERGRFKDPLNPPLFTMLEQIGGLLLHRQQRGLTSEAIATDIVDTINKFPAISQAIGTYKNLVRGKDSEAGKLYESEFVKAQARPLLERFGKESGFHRGSTFNSPIVNVNENSAEMADFKAAMMAGNGKKASELAVKFIEDAKDKDRAIRVLQSTANASNPLYSQTAGIDTEDKVFMFLEWAKKYAPSKVDNFTKVYLQYEAAKPDFSGGRRGSRR